MADKLSRARHARPAASEPCSENPSVERPATRGRHAGVQKTSHEEFAPGKTGLIPVVGGHAGLDRTNPSWSFEQAAQGQMLLEEEEAQLRRLSRYGGAAAKRAGAGVQAQAPAQKSAASSAALISICVIISRITGFGRTWAMAFALGSTFISSAYQVANNLPNMLFELVMGGMLVTAFLPVYVSTKKKLGERRGNDYASNLLTIVVLLLGAVSVLCMIFPAQVIFTQTFYSDQQEMALAVFFFQFFAIQIVFYGASTIVSGLLNANREYFWSSIAPVFNNVIVIASFLAYAFVAQHNQQMAFFVIAIGNPLGVFVQMAIQVPALAKQGIRLRPRLNLRDRPCGKRCRWEWAPCSSRCARSLRCRCRTPPATASPTTALPSSLTRGCGSRSRIRFWWCRLPLPCSPNWPTCRRKTMWTAWCGASWTAPAR